MAVANLYVSNCPYCGHGIKAHADASRPTRPNIPKPEAPTKDNTLSVIVIPSPAKSRSKPAAQGVQAAALLRDESSGWPALFIGIAVFAFGLSWVFGLPLLLLASLLGG